MTMADSNLDQALPPHASAASRARYQIALDLAQRCPPALVKECVLTGSSSRGVADESSDVEQVFYVDVMPTVEEREQWLYEAGVTELISDKEPIEDRSIWVNFRYRGIWVEAGWQTITAHERNLQDILAGKVTDHYRLKLAEIIFHAVSLRSVGLLSRWQQELSHYPEILPPKIISEATELWMFPNIIEARYALIRRGEYLALHERLVRDTHNVLRILFALNRQWEPDWKWIRHATGGLTIKPERLVERINEIFTLPELERCVTTCQKLIYDTLLLASGSYGVGRAISLIGESLRLHSMLE
ncbi:MAG TPA: DUF4037 domain-containing protein [Ktedonobacteraceae bacterium]